MEVYVVKPATDQDQGGEPTEWWVVDSRSAGEDEVVARFKSADDAANEAARLNSVGV